MDFPIIAHASMKQMLPLTARHLLLEENHSLRCRIPRSDAIYTVILSHHHHRNNHSLGHHYLNKGTHNAPQVWVPHGII